MHTYSKFFLRYAYLITPKDTNALFMLIIEKANISLKSVILPSPCYLLTSQRL